VVLDLMEKNSYLSARSRDSLQQLPLKLETRFERIDKEGLAPYFLQHLATELKEILKDYKRPDGQPYNLYTDGLKIYTTLDSRLQQYAEKAVEDHMRQLQKSFDQHWKGKELWKESDPGIQRAIRQSDRYKGLKAQGASEADIQAAFTTPQPMKIWTAAGGEQDTLLSPLDSIRHYLSHLQAGFLAMEPKSGRILAWVGGVNFRTFKYDHVTAKRQVGSTFKPLVYATALARGVDPCEYISNERVVFEGGRDDWSPENADGKYGGYYSLQGGLSQSVNTVSAAVLMKVGVDEAWRAARDYGLEELPRDPTLVLGTADLSLYEMLRAYSVFANRGLRAEPHYLLRIEDAQGKVIAQWKTPAASKRVLEEPVADMMNHMLRSVVDSGTAGRLRTAYGLQGGLAGKTGTTQDQTDGWFIGYSPDVVAGAWVGGEERKVRFRSLSLGQGARTALPIFGLFMQQACNSKAYRKWQSSQFEPPPASALQSLDCPMYVLELPQEEQLFFGPGDGQNALWDFIQRLKQKQEERRQRRIEESGEDPALYYEYTPNPEPRMLPPDSLPRRRSRWDLFRDQQSKRLEPDKP
jgi:penicillin-binding protein 1A